METPILDIELPEESRSDRQERISWWSQPLLQQKRVLVAGAGALGNEVLKNFALAGLSHLFVVDFDHISKSNLSRTVLFRDADIGSSKAKTAHRRLVDLNPDLRIWSLHGDVFHDLGLGLYRSMDLVIGCLDNRLARYRINQSCYKVGVPWIDGGMTALDGQVKLFVPPDGPCYECSLNEQDYQNFNGRFSCPGLPVETFVGDRTPTTATTASIIGGIQSEEAIKFLHGLSTLAGRGVYYNGVGHQYDVLSLPKKASCYGHWTFEPDRIEVLDSHHSETTTVNDLLGLAADRLGPAAIVELDRVIVGKIKTEAEDWEMDFYLPQEKLPSKTQLARLSGKEAIDTPYVLEHITLLEKEMHYGSRTLAQMGMPPWHIYVRGMA